MKLLNKKGEEDEGAGLGDFVRIVLVAIILVAFFYLGYRLIGALIGGGADRTTTTNFNALTDNIQLMLEKPSSFEYQSLIYYMKEKYLVFGFSSEQFGTGITYDKYPQDCNEKPCICLYDTIDNFYLKPKKCKTFEGNIAFHGYVRTGEKLGEYPLSEDTLKNKDGISILAHLFPEAYADYPPELSLKYDYLILGYLGYGRPYYIIKKPEDSYTEFQSDLYVEKFVVDGKTHILVAGGLPRALMDQRIYLLSECPEGSNETCKGKKWNSKVDNGFCYYDEDKLICSFREGTVADCTNDQKITTDCTCGNLFVKGGSGMFCFKRAADNKVFALPFNCNSEEIKKKKCAGYCIALIGGTDDCSEQEKGYCDTDPCGFGTQERPCELYTNFGKPLCGP